MSQFIEIDQLNAVKSRLEEEERFQSLQFVIKASMNCLALVIRTKHNCATNSNVQVTINDVNFVFSLIANIFIPI